MSAKKRVFLVDVSSFIFRAFFALPVLTNSRGKPTNATYGFLTMILKIVEKYKPDSLICVFDSKEPSFRKEIYTDYKANRGAPPDMLIPQFADIDKAVKLLNVPMIRLPGFEADDLIATLVAHLKNENITVVSSDKDLMQLVTEEVRLLDTMKDIYYGPKEVEAKLGILPHQVVDYLALIGDSSDNIPGVPSIGPKTAVDLLKKYGNLDGIYENLSEVKGKRGEVLKTHEKDARLSYTLATVKKDINLDSFQDELNKSADILPVTNEFLNFIKELEIHSLVKKLSTVEIPDAESFDSKNKPKEEEMVAIDSKNEAIFFKKLNDAKEISVFCGFEENLEKVTECKSLNFSLDNTEFFTIEAPDSKFLSHLGKIFFSGKNFWIGHDLKNLVKVFYLNMGSRPVPAQDCMKKYFDVAIASYVIDSEDKNDFLSITTKYLGEEDITSKSHLRFLFALKEQLGSQIKEEKELDLFYNIEMPLVFVLSHIESTGIEVSAETLKELSTKFHKELSALETKIHELAGGEFNLNSPKQLSEILFQKLNLPVIRKTKTGFSTDVEVLEKLSVMHELPNLLLRFRELSKILSTYVDSLPNLIAKDGRIHAHFNQTGTATGRLSSSDPNLQNIPIKTESGRLVRKAFVAKEGYTFVGADYSQVELRIVAHMSQDETLIDAFSKGEDVHNLTAAEIFEVKKDEVTSEQRTVAKAINFGLIYGKTAFGLSQELGISRSEADKYIQNYFKKYSKVKIFMEEQMSFAKKHGYALTMFGRKRKIRDLDSKNMAVRNNAERMAMNTPVQGTAADIMKKAMVELAEAIKDLNASLVLQVHDELVLEVPESDAESTQRILKKHMMGAVNLQVPLEVNLATAKTWYDL